MGHVRFLAILVLAGFMFVIELLDTKARWRRKARSTVFVEPLSSWAGF